MSFIMLGVCMALLFALPAVAVITTMGIFAWLFRKIGTVGQKRSGCELQD